MAGKICNTRNLTEATGEEQAWIIGALAPGPSVEPALRKCRRTYAFMVGRRFSFLVFPFSTFAVITDCLALGVIHLATLTVVRTLYTTRHVQQHFLFTSYNREHDARVRDSPQPLYVDNEHSNHKQFRTNSNETIFSSFVTQHHKQRIYQIFLWSPYGIGQTIIFPCCSLFFLLLLLLFSSPNVSRRRLDDCHTSTHGVALVRI